MPSEQTFVFIDEDQRNKYSKSTLSAINAQVAKHAHRQRNKTVVKPKLPKSKSAPSSPPVAEDIPGASNGTYSTQDDQLNRTRRRSAPESASVTIRRTSGQSITSSSSASPKQRKESVETHNRAENNFKGQGQLDSNDSEDGPPPEALADLFQNLCRITKYPTYQAFPFFLDLEERRLAHYWFTEVLNEDFGMKLNLEDTFQGALTRYPLAFQVPLRWIIAKAADTLHEKTGSQSLAVVYKSREKALNRLQEILRDASTPTDEAVGSIVQSIVHNPEFRKIHLRGLDAMIHARGGLEAVIQSSRVTCAEHIFLQYTFADFDVMNLEELEDLKSQFFSSLMAIQEQAREYAYAIAQMQTWASSVDLLDCSPGGGSNLEKWTYTEQRQRIFSDETGTGRLIRQQYDPYMCSQSKAKLFGALFQLNSFLTQYKSIEEKSHFLRKLEEAARNAATIDEMTCQPVIMPGTHIFMTGHVSRLTQEELSGSEFDEKGVPTAMDGIAAIKIFTLLVESMRARLHLYLQSWLLGTNDKYLSHSDISAMSTVITQLWQQKMRNEIGDERTDYFEA